ncbi:MAG: hypothetical protein JO352_01110 [Chloroflexi bacterium]|nr:hypothetical protein [Chloroflexota bacterium]MBV9602621.1 hypothetical protein [Chloroflexota bacterium]
MNIKRLGACWRANPEQAKDNQVTLAPKGDGNHAVYVSMMNASMMNFAAT